MTTLVENPIANPFVYHKISSNLPVEDYECDDGVMFGFFDENQAKTSDNYIEVPITTLASIDCGGTSNIGDVDGLLLALQSVLANTVSNFNSLKFVIKSRNGTWILIEDGTFGGEKIYPE